MGRRLAKYDRELRNQFDLPLNHKLSWSLANTMSCAACTGFKRPAPKTVIKRLFRFTDGAQAAIVGGWDGVCEPCSDEMSLWPNNDPDSPF